MGRFKVRGVAGAVVASFVAMLVISTPAAAQVCDQNARLPRPIPLGVSGGNINDVFFHSGSKFCAGGTLGSLVQDSSANQYILSNNHVLARVNIALKGERIIQNGLQDTGCVKTGGNTVARLTRFKKISFRGTAENQVDAAIALVLPGDVTAGIKNIGPIAGTIVSPTLGLAVQKMGSTSCLTGGAISAVNVNVGVNYSEFGSRVANFSQQILITPTGFAKPGDSGSLIVTTDPCPQAVALLFAGGSAGVIGNPISTVLSTMNVSMVGTCTAAADVPARDVASDASSPAATTSIATAMDAAISAASTVRDTHNAQLMKIPGAIGTGIGLGDKPGTTAIQVYVRELTPEAQAAAPSTIDGTAVKLIEMGDVRAF
jgi:hypothetical protein